MLFGYNTNGFAHHRLEDALEICAALGYRGVALTLDHYALGPFDPGFAEQLAAVKAILTRHQMRCVIETGARFLLDPWNKHQPTLLSAMVAERELRSMFLQHAVDVAQELGADAVSFWSGTSCDDSPPADQLRRLVEGCLRLCDYAAPRGVRLAFEPEPGMFVDTMNRYAELADRVRHPAFGLTLDLGHLHCQGETPLRDQIHKWSKTLFNIHIEDMRFGRHEHLMFGEGEIDFPPVLQALRECNYTYGIYVELSRHSHQAVATARQALAFLQTAAGQSAGGA